MVKLSGFVEQQLTLWPEWFCHKCGRSFEAEMMDGLDGPEPGPPPMPDEKCPKRLLASGEVPSCFLSLVDTWHQVG